MFSLLAQTTEFTSVTTYSDDGSGFKAFIATYLVFVLVLTVLSVIAMWKIFVKAGVDGWKALVPVYNSWLLFEISGKPGWWSLVGLASFIPVLGIFAGIVGLVLWILAALNLGKAFGKSTAFSVIGLVIFSIVGLLILGFDKSKYTKPATA